MLIGELITVALQSVRANLFRSILTMLGIIIGVASVITMLAVGAGAKAAVDQQIQALGAGLLSIRPGQLFHMGVGQAGETLTADDATALARDNTTLSAIIPERSIMAQAKLGSDNQNLRIVGAPASYASELDYRIDTGRMYSIADDAARRSLAVLGAKVPPKFKETAGSIIGKTVYIRGIPFKIAGVFQEKGAIGWRNVDEQIWVPLETARVRLFGTKSLDLISAKLLPGTPIQSGIVDIERVLRREHRLLPGVDNDFTIQDPRQFLDFQQESAEIFAYLLASIAGVSLVVGGIGIMNIMLVTVTERTREIGIRKALGATRFSIMVQFLVEAMILCLIGGILGILTGLGVSSLLTSVVGWRVSISPVAVALAFGFSAAVGLFFGLWPARKAARMDPIAALRYE